MAKYGAVLNVVVEASGPNEATQKIKQACEEPFESLSIEEGPDEMNEDEDASDEVTEEEE